MALDFFAGCLGGKNKYLQQLQSQVRKMNTRT